METSLTVLNGTNGKKVPLNSLSLVPFPYKDVKKYKNYCGAGDGIGNKLVPETIWGINVSPACFIHDTMWLLAEPTWNAFHASNYVFWYNINNLLRYQSTNSFLYHLRLYRGVTYFNAVDTLGAKIFWELKKDTHGYDKPTF